MFVESKQFKRNLKLFFYDKELPAKGSNNESVVLPVLDCLDNPKAGAPHTKHFSMSKKNKFVSGNAVCVTVTPAQHKLLQLITPIEASDFYKALKHVHYTATYCVDVDFFIPQKHGYVHQILDAIQAIAQEKTNNDLKTA